MRTWQRLFVALPVTLVGLPIFLNACGPRLAEERARYETRVADVRQHIRRYPAYRNHLGAVLEAAEATKKMAERVRDPEKRAELMARANRTLQPQLVSELDQIAPLATSLRRAGRALQRLKLGGADRERANNEAAEVRLALKEAYTTLGAADENDAARALRSAQAANRKLSERLESAKAVLRKLEARERAAGG